MNTLPTHLRTDIDHEDEARIAAFLAAEKARKGRKYNPGPEHAFQVQLKRHLMALIGSPGVLNRLGVYWCSIDTPHNKPRFNAKTGAAFDLDGQSRKARGCVRGIADTYFAWGNGQALWCELKAGRNQPDDEQSAFLAAMRHLGWHTAVVWDRQGVEAVEIELRRCGCPLLGRTSA